LKLRCRVLYCLQACCNDKEGHVAVLLCVSMLGCSCCE
jgi:hypothetical protein